MPIIKDIIERKNLVAAWLKVKKYLLEHEGWVDIEELFSFEARLDEKLEFIHKQLSNHKWKLQEMVPLPRLKVSRKKDDKGGGKTIRQYFWVSIEDQVAWTAVINIIGPILDLEMPGWSLANRLYRSVTYKDVKDPDQKGILKIGPFTHYTGDLYRSWSKSWSLYKYLSFFTWCRMMKGRKFRKEEIASFSEGEKRVYHDYSERVVFLEKDYWKGGNHRKIYWAKIDLENFFPSLNRDAILKAIIYGLNKSEVYTKYEDKQTEIINLEKLLKLMLSFYWKIPNWEENDIKLASLDKKDKGIPVGLLVSGFLANVALLPIEDRLKQKLSEEDPKCIAHFRYVDDHFILSHDLSKLITWIKDYRELIKDIGANYNFHKIEPEQLIKDKEKGEFQTYENIKSQANDLIIDPDDPREFISQTLALISDIAHKDFGLLHLNEQESILEELKHLLKIPLDEDVIKNDTRMSFAINKIIRLIVDWQRDWTSKVAEQRELSERLYVLEQLAKKYKSPKISIRRKIKTLIRKLDKNEETIPDKKEYEIKVRTTFNSLIETCKSFPEKLRLWRFVVIFCKKTGYGGWDDIGKRLNFYIRKTGQSRQYKFIKTLIWLELSKELIKSAKILNNPHNFYSWEVELQKSFISSIKKWQSKLPISNKPEKYEKIAWKHLCNCIKLSKFIVKKEKCNFRKPELCYWAEINITSPYSIEPSKIWEDNINNLDFNNGVTKTLMLMYPNKLREKAPRKFHLICSMFKKKFKVKQTGWEFEGKKSSKTAPSSRIDLITWCDWTKQKQEECNRSNDYDPRISEWTALEIINLILNYLQPDIHSIETFSRFVKQPKKIIIHPANFTIPKLWGPSCDKTSLSWDEWENIISNKANCGKVKKITSLRYYKIVQHDHRIIPFWLPEDIDMQNPRINYLLYSIGILLLGLLRKSFDWPSRWNLPAYSRDWRYIGREIFSSSPFSSDTLSILEALLLPRYIELRNKSHFVYDYDDITIYDQGPIANMDDLKKRITIAKENLVRIDSFQKRTRQLTPISIPTLLNRHWLMGAE